MQDGGAQESPVLQAAPFFVRAVCADRDKTSARAHPLNLAQRGDDSAQIEHVDGGIREHKVKRRVGKRQLLVGGEEQARFDRGHGFGQGVRMVLHACHLDAGDEFAQIVQEEPLLAAHVQDAGLGRQAVALSQPRDDAPPAPVVAEPPVTVAAVAVIVVAPQLPRHQAVLDGADRGNGRAVAASVRILQVKLRWHGASTVGILRATISQRSRSETDADPISPTRCARPMRRVASTGGVHLPTP